MKGTGNRQKKVVGAAHGARRVQAPSAARTLLREGEYSNSAVATAAFKESTGSRIGIVSLRSRYR